MLLPYLASWPDLPVALREHLAVYASADSPRAAAGVVRLALAANDGVPFALAHRLLDGLDPAQRRTVRIALLRRSTFSDQDAAVMLQGDPRVPAVLDVVSLYRSEALDRHVYATFTSTQVKAALLRAPGAAREVVRACAADLTAGPGPVSKQVRATLRTLATRELDGARTAQENAEALAWAAAVGVDVDPRPFELPVPGTAAWLVHPSVSNQDVIEWVSCRALSRETWWEEVLRVRPDPDGELAAAAWCERSHTRGLLVRVMRSRAPLDVRRQAARELLAAVARERANDRWRGESSSHAAIGHLREISEFIAEHGDLSMYAALRESGPSDADRWHLQRLVERLGASLSSDDLEQVMTLATDDVPRVMWGLWLTAHPSASAEQRARGAAQVEQAARRENPDARLAAEHVRVARAARHLEAGDPESVAAVAGAIPAQWLATFPPRELFGLAWLFPHAVRAHLPAPFTADTARALTTLVDAGHTAQDPVADLMSNVAAVAA